MEEQFETACEDGTIPGAVLLASNHSGTSSRLLFQRHRIIKHRFISLCSRIRRPLPQYPKAPRNEQHHAHSLLHEIDDLNRRHAMRRARSRNT